MPFLIKLKILIVLSILLPFCHSGNDLDSLYPAASFRLTRSGLDILSKLASTILPSFVLNAVIPDFGTSISYTKIDLKQFRVLSFTNPIISYSLLPPNKMGIDLKTGPIVIAGNWSAEKPTLWMKQYDRGLMKLTIQDFKTSVVAELGTLENGLPALTSTSCVATMGKANMNILNATQNFFIDMMQTFSLVFRTAVQSQMCAMLKSQLISNINQRLQAMPTMWGVGQTGVRFLTQTLVIPEYVEVTVKAALEN